MCEVKNRVAAGEAPVQEDDALEKIFSECDAPSTGRVSVAKLIGYMRDHMSAHGSPEILKDLRKSMSAASYDGQITREQYYNVSRTWLAGIRKRQQYQELQGHEDGNNNIHVDHNSGSFSADDAPQPAAEGQSESTPRVRTTLVLADNCQPPDDITTRVDISTGSGSQSDARSLQGFLDLSTSTVVDTAESCEGRDSFFGDLSSVDGTYHMAETTQDLRQRVHKCALDNEHLREELQRAEDSTAILERELALLRRKLESTNSRYERLQGEHEEHRELLAAAERNRDILEAKTRRLEKDNSVLRKEMASAEAEMRRLNADLDRANEQEEERNRMLAHCRMELLERQTLYDEARGQILQMELANDQLREKHDVSTSTAEHLKAVVKELENRISELEPSQSYILHDEGLFASLHPGVGLEAEVDMFQESAEMIPRSLRDEMKATEYGDPETVSHGPEIRDSDDTMEEQNMNNSEYVEVLHWATEELKRGTAELAAAGHEQELRMVTPPPSRSDADTVQRQLPLVDQAWTKTADERRASTVDLQLFKFQIRHALAVLSSVASRKVMTNAGTKDATTQLDDRLVSVPELPAVCNIDAGITSRGANDNNNNNNNNSNNNNNGDIDKFCPACRKENRSRKEGEDQAALTVDVSKSALAASSARSADPWSGLSLDVCLQASEVTGTPRSSSRHSTPPASPGYIRERSIIVPIVAALDEIIQGTRVGSSSSSSSESDAGYSPVGSRREHNPRYIYTLPSGRASEIGDDPQSGAAESPLFTMPRADARQAIHANDKLSQSPRGPDPESPGSSAADVLEAYAWRCPESTTTDDTSDDTYGTGSDTSHSLSTMATHCHSSTLELSGTMGMGLSHSAIDDGGFERTGRKAAGATETRGVELTPVALRGPSVSPRSETGEGRDSDTVQGLNLDLERLTLTTCTDDASPDKYPAAINSSCRERTTIIERASCDPPNLDTIPVSPGCQPHGKLPKRKLSVYQRSLDYYSRLEVQGPRKNAVWKSVQDETPSASRVNGPSNRPSSTPNSDGHDDTADEGHSTTLACTQSGSGSFATTTTPGRISERHHLPVNTTWPTETEVNLENRPRTKYVVISGTRSPPLPILTPCLPTSVDVPGDVASADAAERRSDGREIPSGSRSVALAMSSEEDSSDSECAAGDGDRIDRIHREESVQVVAFPFPPPPPPAQRSSPSSTPSPLTASLIPPQAQARPSTPVSPSLASHPPPLPPPPPPPPPALQLQATVGVSQALLFGDPLPYGRYRGNTDREERSAEESDENSQPPSKNNQRLHRSLSESDSGLCRGNTKYNCTCRSDWTRDRATCGQGGDYADTAEDPKSRDCSFPVFPSLPDTRLIELGLVGSSGGFDPCERMGEDELERKYTALSIGLGTDRVTLPRRLALSLRQRDQAERNLATEVDRMQRDIQALAPLCMDRESVERVERVRHQLEMISRCALRVSSTAELLGATHQERRVSRAALLADKYLQALRTRCDKLFAELAETKRILNENNIVIEENPGELIDDVVPRVRYRGVPSNNRVTMSRRRASIATISRPAMVNPLQEPTKDAARQQRTSVPARMSLRRPSLSYDTQRWDNEKLDRTDSSSSSIGELREIFEQAESRRGSREENNNLIRSQSSNLSVGSCESGDSDVWATTREDTFGVQAPPRDEKSFLTVDRPSSLGTPRILRTVQEHISSLPVSWYILFVAVFFFGFYSNRFVTTRSAAPLKWWSVDEIIKRYLHVQRNIPPPF